MPVFPPKCYLSQTKCFFLPFANSTLLPFHIWLESKTKSFIFKHIVHFAVSMANKAETNKLFLITFYINLQLFDLDFVNRFRFVSLRHKIVFIQKNLSKNLSQQLKNTNKRIEIWQNILQLNANWRVFLSPRELGFRSIIKWFFFLSLVANLCLHEIHVQHNVYKSAIIYIYLIRLSSFFPCTNRNWLLWFFIICRYNEPIFFAFAKFIVCHSKIKLLKFKHFIVNIEKCINKLNITRNMATKREESKEKTNQPYLFALSANFELICWKHHQKCIYYLKSIENEKKNGFLYHNKVAYTPIQLREINQ